jgi:hypothetical protein
VISISGIALGRIRRGRYWPRATVARHAQLSPAQAKSAS